jgi:hypothetical protein
VKRGGVLFKEGEEGPGIESVNVPQVACMRRQGKKLVAIEGKVIEGEEPNSEEENVTVLKRGERRTKGHSTHIRARNVR